MTPSKILSGVGVAAGHYNNALEAASHTYMTDDGRLPSTQLVIPDNPYNAEVLNAKHVLEIGCGIGRNLQWIMENTSAHYYGLDPNASMLCHFWEVQDVKWAERVTLVKSFDRLPEHVKFDLVVVTFVFQHIGFRTTDVEMNVGDITLEALNRCADGAVWFMYEHDSEEHWINPWLEYTGITPHVYMRNYTKIPQLNDRGAHHLIIFKK
jgi:SAM-dependent methyltransferase